MYLHLGKETVVSTGDIIGIFDIDNTTIAKTTREFLATAQKTGEVVDVSPELPKTFIVCCPPKERRQTVYISQISTATLFKRNHGTMAAEPGATAEQTER